MSSEIEERSRYSHINSGFLSVVANDGGQNKWRYKQNFAYPIWDLIPFSQANSRHMAHLWILH
jgi:hypothetical protein